MESKSPIYLDPFETLCVTPSVEDVWSLMPWERRGDSPRFECWFAEDGRSYTYGKGRGERTYLSKVLELPPEGSMYHILQIIWRIAMEKAGCKFEGCFVNGYQDGSDHLGWHSDDGPDIDPNRPIAVFTLGAKREIWTRPTGQTEAFVQKHRLDSGSMFIMPAGFQATHQHRIPKADFSPCGPRISFTFRGLV